MSRTLDFIVAGAARSGTTAVADYLSAVNSIHCGIEVFRFQDDHSKLLAPDCFLDLAKEGVPVPHGASRRVIDWSAAEIARKGGEIKFFGNKTPLYAYRLRGLLREIAPGKCIFTWRGLRASAKSYVERATDPNDRYPASRRGISAMADSLASMIALDQLRGKQVLIVPNRAVVADWRKSMDVAARFIVGETPFAYEDALLEKIEARRERASVKKKRRSALITLSRQEEAAIDFVKATGIDGILDRDVPFDLGTVVADIGKAIALFPRDPIQELLRLADEEGDPEVTKLMRVHQAERFASLLSADQQPGRGKRSEGLAMAPV